MLPDAEINSLAEEVFDKAFKRARGLGAMYLYNVDDRSMVFYGGPEFSFSLLCLPTIKRIIRQCDELIDATNIADRNSVIRLLVDLTVTDLIRDMGNRISAAIDVAVRDGMVTAEAVLGG